jgi:hypothetical protein
MITLPRDALESLLRELRSLNDLIYSIQSALGTEEIGEYLVSVARDAHRAEMKLSGLYLNGTLKQE